MENLRACTKCKQLKSFSDFYLKNQKPYAACKTCHNKQSMAWQSKNKKRFANYKKKWQTENNAKVYNYVSKYKADKPDLVKKWRSDWGAKNTQKAGEYRAKRKAAKAKIRIGIITNKEVQDLLRKPCIYCAGKSEHLDHVVPLSRGGSHTIGNLAPACSSCNLSKATKTIMEWRIWKTRL